MEAVFMLRQLMEQFWADKKNLYTMFVGLEKAYERVPRHLIWRILETKRNPRLYNEVIKDMYARASTCVEQ